MVLQSSGAISLNDIQTEFGGTNPIGINEYYGAASGVPASGEISFDDFYGKSNYIPPTYFSYYGSTQTYTAPRTGSYKLEAWGARGGDGSNYSSTGLPYTGGNGGYAVATISLSENDILYICCGQQGGSGVITTSYTFNGGAPPGNGNYAAGQGGGATHIAFSNGVLTNVSQSQVIIVAGGGGGGGNCSLGGGGGGTNGETKPTSTQFGNRTPGAGGTQTAGGVKNGIYGKGGTAGGQNLAGGGGGGWYGGGGGANSTGGGGGSGRINSSYHTLTNSSMQTGIWNGAGKAKITPL
jgi:hypothetical protein